MSENQDNSNPSIPDLHWTFIRSLYNHWYDMNMQYFSQEVPIPSFMRQPGTTSQQFNQFIRREDRVDQVGAETSPYNFTIQPNFSGNINSQPEYAIHVHVLSPNYNEGEEFPTSMYHFCYNIVPDVALPGQPQTVALFYAFYI